MCVEQLGICLDEAWEGGGMAAEGAGDSLALLHVQGWKVPELSRPTAGEEGKLRLKQGLNWDQWEQTWMSPE